MSGGSCRAWNGAAKSRSGVPSSVTRQLSVIGSAIAGPRSKKAERLGAHLVFIDESGFLLIPNVKRTWAPRGQTPSVVYNYSHKKVSAMTALAVSPKRRRIALYLRFRRRSFKGLDAKRFLQALLKQIPGPILALWDRGRIHRDLAVKQLIADHPRLQVEEFPGYAPDLNPAEYVWCQTDSALANSLLKDQDHLMTKLVNKRRTLKRSSQLLWACILAADLPWP